MRTATVRFLVDFRGKLTNEIFYVAGSEAAFPIATAAQLVEEGRAEYTENDQDETTEDTEDTESSVETEPETEAKPTRKRRSRK